MGRIISFKIHPEDRERIKEMARRYFGRNPRLVKSFVRDLAFLINTIGPRYEYLNKLGKHAPEEEQEKKNLQEIIDNPALLAKIIVIREKLPADFSKIQEDPTIISKLEENPGVDISGLSPEVKNFIVSWPLFKEPSRNANPANFILLGGSSGTAFREEIDVGQFINYANVGDAENFHTALSKSPKYKLTEYLTSVIDAYKQAGDETVKMNIAKSVLPALYLVENNVERNNLLKDVILWAESNNGALFNQLTTEQIQKWALSVIGSDKETDQLGKMISSAPYGNSDEGTRNRFWESLTLSGTPDPAPGILAKILSQLLNDASFQNKQLIFELLNKENFASRVAKETTAGNALVTFCINQGGLDEKVKAITLIEKIPPDEDNKKTLIEHLLTLVSGGDENQKSFAKQNLQKTNLWPSEKINLDSLATSFQGFYKGLDQNEKNSYQSIIEFLNGKGVWNGKRKRKSVVK